MPRPYLAPGRLTRLLNVPIRRLRLQPVLAVRGRRSGAWRTTPVTPVRVDGTRYLVAPRGETEWARNLRASGEAELRTLRGTRLVRAHEAFGAERERAVAAYRRLPGRAVWWQFSAIPDPADHPVFRLDPR